MKNWAKFGKLGRTSARELKAATICWTRWLNNLRKFLEESLISDRYSKFSILLLIILTLIKLIMKLVSSAW